MKKYFAPLYFILAIANTIGIRLAVPYLEYASRFMLMPVLLALLTVQWTGKKDKVYIAATAALLLAWLADILMILSENAPEFFAYGQTALLAAQIIYIFIFYSAHTSTRYTPNRIFITSRILILAFAGGAFLNVLWPSLGGAKFYVLLYTVVILLMGVTAVLRREKTSANSFSFVYGGALMLIVSDGMVAVSRFLHSFAFQSELIMISYMLAQFFIVKGIIAHNEFVRQKDA